MKKLLLVGIAILAFGMAEAQNFKILNGAGNLKSTVSHPVTDTITNAVTKYQYGIVEGYNDIIVVQPTFTKISGTAAATVKLQGSVDGVSYTDTGSPSSFTVTDVASQSTAFVVTPSNYRYYRLSIVPTGTQSVKITSPVIYRLRPIRQ